MFIYIAGALTKLIFDVVSRLSLFFRILMRAQLYRLDLRIDPYVARLLLTIFLSFLYFTYKIPLHMKYLAYII